MKFVYIIVGIPKLADFTSEITSKGSQDIVVIDLTGLLGFTSFYDVVKTEEVHHLVSSVQWINGRQYAKESFGGASEAYLDWIAEQPNVPVAGKKSLKEWFTYRREISLWWFTALSQKHPLKSPMVRYIHQIHILERVINELSPRFDSPEESHWVLWVDNLNEGYLFRQLITQYLEASPTSISFEIRCGQELSGLACATSTLLTVKACALALYRRVVPVLAAIRATLRAFEHVITQLRFLRRITNTAGDDANYSEQTSAPQNVRALFVTEFPTTWQCLPERERYDEKVKWEDRYFGSAPFYLYERGVDVRWLPIPQDRHQLSEWRLRLEDQPLPDVLGASSPGWDVLPRLFVHGIWWWFLYIWLIVIRKVHHQWKYADISVGWLVREDFYRLCTERGIRYGFLMEYFRKAMHTFQPDVVFFRKEFYSYARMIVAVAPSKTGTFGVQHGLAADVYYPYRMRSSEIGSEQSEVDYIRYAPIPSRIVAFGEYTREFMSQKNGYPADRIDPVGSLRHDVMAARYSPDSLSSDHQKNGIRRRLGLPERARIVLVCTGLTYTAPAWFKLVVEGIQYGGLDAFVAVKLHPFHGGERHAHEIAEGLRFGNYLVVKEGPIADFIYASDVVVTGSSTTGLEAVLLGRPLIIVANEERYDVYPFVQEQVALPAANGIEMGEALESFWSERFSSKEWAEIRERFLARHLNNADARARERLYQLIISRNNADGRS